MGDRERTGLGRPEAAADARCSAPHVARNAGPIAAVLRDVLPERGLVLEVASGTGEHVLHFAREFPELTFQPSDPNPPALASIAAWRGEAGLENLLPPIALDAREDRWPVERADAILCINMVHISPWAATAGLMRGAGRLLAAGAPLYLYGPYRQEGVETAPSNEAFDESLRARHPEWGLRTVEEVAAENAAPVANADVYPAPAGAPLLGTLDVVEVRDVTHVQDHRLVGRGAEAVVADGHRVIELHLLVEVVGVEDVADAELGERAPVRDQHFRIRERHLHVVREAPLLILGQLRAQVGNGAVVAGENALLRAHRVRVTAVHVGHVDGGVVGRVRHVDHGAVQSNPDRPAFPVELRVVEPRGISRITSSVKPA